MNTVLSLVLKYFWFIIIAACYYIYNSRMFQYIEILMNRRIAVQKSRILTFILNYMIFAVISQLQFYLIVNWTIFCAFLIIEMIALYHCSLKMGLFCGIQGALVGLAFNFITRSGAAFLMNQPLLAFDSVVQSAVVNLKPVPIGIGFCLAGAFFHWMSMQFSDWQEDEYESDKLENLSFSLWLVIALFVYLVLNLLIYFTPADANDTILKVWGMKSGICALVGYYIGTGHIYALVRLKKFERRSRYVREELTVCLKREEQLEEIACADCLTGCCVREVGRQYIQRAYAEGKEFCICFIDVNELKPVNDGLGHDMGDRYLSAVAHVIVEAAKGDDVACRYGGDEFLLITLSYDIAVLNSRMENAQRALQELSGTSEYPFRLWISYGTAGSKESGDMDTLIKLADERMYEYKMKAKMGI